MDFITPFIRFLLLSDYVRSNKVFLNAINAEDGNIGIVTSQIDRNQDVEYIDGSVRHKLIFTINDYKSISFNRFVTSRTENNGNLNDLLNVQNIVDYIISCERAHIYPDFGSDYEVEKMESAYLTPSTPLIENTNNPLAKYSIPIIVYVTDYAEAIR